MTSLIAPTLLLAKPTSAATDAGVRHCLTIGIGSSYQWSSTSANMIPDLTMLKSKGIDRIREDIFWQVVQPDSPDEWHWTSYDRLFTNASQLGVQILPIIGYGTTWASSPKTIRDIPSSTAGQQAYARFAAAVVARYGANGTFWSSWPAGSPRSFVTTIELWNEPWLAPSAPSVRDFVTLVAGAADAVHAVDRNVATMINVDDRWTNASDAGDHFWGAAVLKYADLLRPKIDRWAIHPYAWPSGNPLAAQQSLAQIQWLRTLLVKNHMRGSLWITEIGFSTADQPLNLLAGATLWSSFLTGLRGLTGAFAPEQAYVFTSSRPNVGTKRGSWDYGLNLVSATGASTSSLDAVASARCGSTSDGSVSTGSSVAAATKPTNRVVAQRKTATRKIASSTKCSSAHRAKKCVKLARKRSCKTRSAIKKQCSSKSRAAKTTRHAKRMKR